MILILLYTRLENLKHLFLAENNILFKFKTHILGYIFYRLLYIFCPIIQVINHNEQDELQY